MNPTFTATLFTGESLAGVPVTVTVAAGRLCSVERDPPLDVALTDVRASDRLANVPRFLYLPGERTLETADNAAIDALLAAEQRGRLAGVIHALEIHSRAAAVATVLLVASVAASVWWGLPVLARRAAYAVPERIEAQAGRAALTAFNRLLQPSQLGFNDRSRVQLQLDRLVGAGRLARKPQLEFRSMGGSFPNAFALPGGTIVFSDELVQLTDGSDEEIAAVLAHELGHWQLRHGLQGVLRSSAALLVVTTVTGDLSTLTTFAGTIPFTLLQRGYSREFESEADRYAVDLLRQAGVDPEYFATILAKLEAKRPKAGQDFTYLSTHPSSDDRIKRLGLTGKLPAKPAAKTPPAPETALPAATAALPLTAPLKAGEKIEEQADVAPVAISRRAPVYPFSLRVEKISGSVTVEFIIDPTGTVRDAKVVRSTDTRFEEPALAAIAGWSFSPGRRHGRPVAVRASQLLTFNPDDAPAPPLQ